MFGVPALGFPGNAPRSILRGPGLGTWDLTLAKDTKVGFLGEGGNIEFRAEMFNLLNRANFGFMNAGMTAFNANTTSNAGCSGQAACALFAPNGSSSTNPLGTVGQITNTSTTSRQIQLALRISF
jgi:hypothetical protein